MKLNKCIDISWCLFAVFILWASIHARSVAFKDPKLLSLTHLTQVVRDWKTVPLVDLLTTTAKKCPRSHPEQVFFKMWPGIFPYCDCQARVLNKKKYYSAYEATQFVTKKFWVNEECPTINCGGKNCWRVAGGCKRKRAAPPVLMNDLGGFRVCGLRGGDPFDQAVRLDGKGKCQKEGYEPC